MPLISPRLTDLHGIHKTQAELAFAIPHFDEDIPLYVDPFLLWSSPSQQDQALHTSLLNSFNQLGADYRSGNQQRAIETLIRASECDEVGLGSSSFRRGKRISEAKAREVLELFVSIPQYAHAGFRHFEEIQLFVEGISKDRISDISCSFLKSFLIDFTIDECKKHGIPMSTTSVPDVYNYREYRFSQECDLTLPINPKTSSPIILVPKRWLRFNPWISYEDYFKHYCPLDEFQHEIEDIGRIEVLAFNRNNYGALDNYIKEKERKFSDCVNDPLFSQIPLISAKRKLNIIEKLKTGKEDNADKDYENSLCQLLPSLLYPQLDFAAEQSRTESGAQIRDLIFYNNQSHEFLKHILDKYDSRQLVFEMKNVAKVSRDHINQLNRYMTDTLGKFGVLVTRHPISKARMKNTIDLWSGQRRTIVVLTDSDIAQMVELFESKQRLPLDVLKKKYVEFSRLCPS